MRCDFDNGSMCCAHCGFRAGGRNWRRNCPAKREANPPRPPGTTQRLANFTLAAIGHVAAGAPTCAQEEIDARHAVCRSCELYRPDPDNPEVGVCSHQSCGCTITRLDKFVSKLAWRDQQCPLGKWPDLDAGPDLSAIADMSES